MLKSKKAPNKALGFTVIEVLIGIGLFSVIMPSIIVAVVSINQLNDKSADLTSANILAEKKIETLRNAGYNTLAVGSYDFTGELAPTFTSPRQATFIITTPEAGVKEINVTIEYTHQGSLRTITYQSLMSELGVSQ
jgi:Tfp pilus assembly protein PilV